MQVMYQDNKIGQIDSALLNSMLDARKIKMFMRSDGWVMVGVAHMRGEGGPYEGVERNVLEEFIKNAASQLVAEMRK